MLTYPRYFLLFIIYSFFGWCCEVIYVGLFVERKFVNRGFLHGPICPIYGFGGLIVMFGLKHFSGTWIQLFFTSLLFCSILEYVTSWLLETLFRTKWWDYSDLKFNINGRICLLNSVLFGIGGVICAHFVQPLLMTIVMMFTDQAAEWTARIFLFLLFVDLMITLRRLVDFSTTMVNLKDFMETLQERFSEADWFKNTSISEMLASVKKQAELHREEFNQSLLEKVEVFSRHQRNAESFMKRFPTMTSYIYRQPLLHIKSKLKEGIAEKKTMALARRKAKKAAKQVNR